MNLTADSNWYKANTDYLVTAVSPVHRALENFLTSKQNQPFEEVPEIQSSLEAIAAAMSAPPALEHLCTTFNLSPFDRQILLLCVAHAIIPDFSSLCLQAQSDLQMAYPTFGLALQLFPTKHWSSLTPEASLRRWQLLELGTGQVVSLCPLQIDESILHYLMGEPYQDMRLMSIIQPLSPAADRNLPLQPTHQQLAERLAATLSGGVGSGESGDGETRGHGEKSTHPDRTSFFPTPHSLLPIPHSPIIQLCGTESADKWAIASAACTMMGHPLKIMSARRLPTDAEELHHLLQRWERDVVLTNSVLLLDCDQLNTADTVRETALWQLIQETRTPLIITTEERLHSPQRPLITLDVPFLSHSEQLAIWQSSLGPIAAELNGHVEGLVTQFNLSTLAIQAACLEVSRQSSGVRSRKREKDSSCACDPLILNSEFSKLWDICRSMARPRLDDLAQRIDTSATWDDLVLPDAQRQTLRSIAAHVRQRAKVYQEWGFAGKSGRGLGISALFSGTSGTGKTMAAEVVAKELRLDLYRIDLSAVVSKYIGETEKNLRRIFDAAEAGGAVLLFDEADALFGKRTQVKDSHDRHANVEVSYLLQRMEAYQGLAILTTNLKDSLDQAFLRRIRFVVPFPFPDVKGRAEIWRHIFPSSTPTKNLDLEKLAKLNVAGGNIRNIALNAAFIAADAGEPVMMKHILTATKSEYLKLERTLTEIDVKGWV